MRSRWPVIPLTVWENPGPQPFSCIRFVLADSVPAKRRTFAKLAHKGHAALEEIQISLGHASIQTTERYLGMEQDLTDAPCDHLGLRV